MATCVSTVAAIGVLTGDSRYNNCLRAVRRSCYGGQGGVFQMERKLIGCTAHGFSKGLKGCISSSNSDGVVSDASWDGSLISEQNNQKSDGDTLKLVSGECYLPLPADVGNRIRRRAYLMFDGGKDVIDPDGAGSWETAFKVSSKDDGSIRKALSRYNDLSKVLEQAYSANEALGRSTAFEVGLRDQNLIVINLGGCEFIVVRGGKILISKSRVELYPHDIPRPLERGNGIDVLNSGQIFEFPTVPGDAIISGSKSLFDDLSSKEIATIVGDAVDANLSHIATAQKIAVIARQRAIDRQVRSLIAICTGASPASYFGIHDLTVSIDFVSTSTTNGA